MDRLESWLGAVTGTPVFQVLFGFAALMLVLLGVLSQVRPAGERDWPDPARALRAALGATGVHPFWLTIAVALWGALFLLLFLGLLATIWAVVSADIPKNLRSDAGKAAIWEFRFLVAKLGGLTAVLGAVVALPFTMIRLRLSNEDNETKKAALYNDKIDAALADLHAQRQVTIVENGVRHTVWEDDITRRNGAIDRLEALAHENPDDAKRISRMLCTYVRELSREHPPDKPPEDADHEALHTWAQGLKPVRSDMENAAQTIGRLTDIDGVTAEDLDRDLQGANLQGYRLRSLNFDHTDLQAAHLAGAALSGTHLGGADLVDAHLVAANLVRAHLDRADLVNSHMEGANLMGAHLDSTNLWDAHLEEADLGTAHLEGANLSRAHLDRANLWRANLEAASLMEAHLEGAYLMEARLKWAYLARAHLEGANLREADLEEAYLVGAHLSRSTDFTGAHTSLAAANSADWSMVALDPSQVTAMFGDASVGLPEGVVRPAHWPDIDLDFRDFNKEWELYKSDPEAYVPPQDRD